MSLTQGVQNHFRVLGWPGVLAITLFRFFGFPKEFTVRHAGVRHPVHIRLRTTDLSIYEQILLRGQYDFDLPSAARTIVDAGANIGMSSIFYAHRFPNAKIIAVEAEASNFAMLVKNVAAYPNIVPIHAALWSTDGDISVGAPDPSTGAHGKWGFVTREGTGPRVRAVTMRTLMAESSIDSIDLLKVDIEGAETEVFQKSEWMHQVDCFVIELHDRFKPGCSAAVESATRGFSKLQRGEMTFYRRVLLQEGGLKSQAEHLSQ